MNPDRIADLVAQLGCMKFFPGDVHARLGIVADIGEMCSSEDQAEWLIRRTIKLYREWPGAAEMRAVFCSKYKPKDGIEAYSDSYPDGIPSEKEAQPLLAAPAVKSLPGEVLSAAPTLDVHIRQLAEMKRIDNTKPIRPKDLPAVRITEANAVTESDIARAVEDLRRKRAEAEVDLTPVAEVQNA